MTMEINPSLKIDLKFASLTKDTAMLVVSNNEDYL